MEAFGAGNLKVSRSISATDLSMSAGVHTRNDENRLDRQALFGVAQAFSLWRFQSNADRGQAPASQGAHASPYLAAEARRRVDTASLSPRSTTAVFRATARVSKRIRVFSFRPRVSKRVPQRFTRADRLPKRSRDRQGANAKLRKHETGGSNSAQALRSRDWPVIFDEADPFGTVTV